MGETGSIAPPNSESSSSSNCEDNSRAARLAWKFMIVGALTPIAVGILLRYYLLFTDQPYAKWSDIFSALHLLALPLILPCIPFALLSLIIHGRLLRTGRVGEVLYGAFVGGEVSAIVAYWLWWHYPDGLIELAYFLPFVIPAVIAAGMMLGTAAGWGVGRVHRLTRHLASSHSS